MHEVLKEIEDITLIPCTKDAEETAIRDAKEFVAE